MTLAVLGTLLVLALVDSTSTGTLIIPIWLLLAPSGFRVRRMAAYLTTVAVFYFGVGVLLLLGVDLVTTVVDGLSDRTWLRWAQLVLGVALFALSFKPTRAPDPAADGSEQRDPGRLRRWRDRVAQDGTVRGLVGLALIATTMELAMMLPYLAAVGTLASSGATWPTMLLVLAGYCLVMVLPALALTTARAVARRAVDPLLHRLDAWTTRNAGEMTA